MKVSKISTYSPSFGIKIPKGLNNDILSVTKQLYDKRAAKKLLKQLELLSPETVSLNSFNLGFSRYLKGNVFVSFILSDNKKRSAIVRGCLGQYSKENFPLSKIKTLFDKTMEFFV